MEKTNKSKLIFAVCQRCAQMIYPSSIRKSELLNGITISEGKCDICDKSSYLTPIRDYWYAITHNEAYFD